MFRKSFVGVRLVAPALAALAALAVTTADGRAQFGMGPYGFGPAYGGYSFNQGAYGFDPVVRGGYYGGGDYTRFYAYGRPYFPSLYYGGFGGYGGFGAGFSPYGFGSPRGPLVGAYPYGPSTYGYTPRVYTAPPNGYAASARNGDNKVNLDIEVPPNAEVWIEDSRTTQTGATRHFVSPALTPGRTYTYEIRARWTEDGREVSRTQRIEVQPGERYTVSFANAGREGPKQKIQEFLPPKKDRPAPPALPAPPKKPSPDDDN